MKTPFRRRRSGTYPRINLNHHGNPVIEINLCVLGQHQRLFRRGTRRPGVRSLLIKTFNEPTATTGRSADTRRWSDEPTRRCYIVPRRVKGSAPSSGSNWLRPPKRPCIAPYRNLWAPNFLNAWRAVQYVESHDEVYRDRGQRHSTRLQALFRVRILIVEQAVGERRGSVMGEDFAKTRFDSSRRA